MAEFDQEQAIKDYTRLMEAGPLAENEEELHSLIEQGYAHGLYFDYDRDRQTYVLRHGEQKESIPRSGECVECGRYSSQLSANGYCEGCVMQAAIDAMEPEYREK